MRTPRTTTLGAALLIGLVCTSVQAREAFPKDSPIRTVCVACHVPDPQGNIPVLQSLRATPSAFRLIVRRMERNYKVKLTDEQRERAIRDLSRAQALSPAEYDELQNYLAAHPYEPLPPVPQGITLPKDIERTCLSCHAHQVWSSQRRTPEAWTRIKDMHLGTWPTLLFSHREMRWDLRAAETVNVLARAFPLITPLWKSWAGPEREKPLPKSMLVSGRQLGLGPFHGTVSLNGGPDTYEVKQTLQYDSGKSVEMTGKAQCYAGYLLEFKGKLGTEEVEGAFYRPPGDGSLKAKWKAPAASYLQADAQWTPAGAATLYHSSPTYAVTKGGEVQVTLYLAKGTGKVSVPDISCNDASIRVKAVKAEADRVVVSLLVPKQPKAGKRILRVKGFQGTAELNIAPDIQFLKVLPDPALARIGGGSVPAEGVQFETRGYHPGPDGKRFTADDLDLGPVDCRLQLEEYSSSDKQDDVRWCGTLSQDGLFLPASEAPNPQRVRRVNTGDMWVAAHWKPQGARHALRARTLLRVVVPDYRKDI